MDLPRNLYKSPGKLVYSDKLTYDTILVSDKEEYNTGIKEGYIDNFNDALHSKAVKEAVKKEVIKKEVIKKESVKKEIDNFDDDF